MERCNYNNKKSGYCQLFEVPCIPELCTTCKNLDGINKGFSKMLQLSLDFQKAFKGPCNPAPIKTEDEIELCLETCRACPHSTRDNIKASDITEWPFGVKHVIALIGNLLKKTPAFSLRCKLCGCSCSLKSEAVSKRLISGGCPDINKETKLSRWEAALKKVGS